MKRIQQQHAEVFLRLADQAEPELIRAQQQSWLNRLEFEHANLRAALDYLIAAADGDRALRLATALHRFWDYRGYVGEGREWLKKTLAIRGTATIEMLAHALNAAGWLAYRQGDLDQARLLHEEGLFLFEQAEEDIGIADSLQHLAIIEMDQGDYATAQPRLEQALSLCRTPGTCTIQAAQVGNASFNPAPPVTQSFSISTQGGGGGEQKLYLPLVVR